MIGNPDIRTNFSSLLEKMFSRCHKLRLQSSAGTAASSVNSAVPSVKTADPNAVDILKYLVGLLDQDVANSTKYCSQYFWVISMFAQMGPTACTQLFSLGVFSSCIK